jgi:hypothetical protein
LNSQVDSELRLFDPPGVPDLLATQPHGYSTHSAMKTLVSPSRA